ncbi:AAA family ATPase [Enterococcus mundtii]|uniref:AAA family ATPase n=1 Tax=Enterococcus TaxID=1350 RepID=UPI00189BA3C7|nr:AAA family ATPase [Enterococcus mundtii]MDB7100908.1 zeta toxin family protein [Enterococcus mundtii]
MNSKLIILRGNSASGKSTIASKIRQSFPRGEVMLISQDEVRLHILNVKDRIENPTADLIQSIALFGQGKFKVIVIEGILGTHIYKEMLVELVSNFQQNAHIYYFDISFGETVNRHKTREKSAQWGEKVMKKWWLEKDYLRLENEKTITDYMSEEQILKIILKDLEQL